MPAHFFRRRRRLKQAILDPVEARAADGRRVRPLAGEGMAEDVRVRDVHHVQRLTLEAFALGDL